MAGSFNGSTTFGIGEEHETTLEALSGTTIFINRYNPAGYLLWSIAECGNGCRPGRDIAASATNGTFMLTGDFAWQATFGIGQENETQVSTSGLDASEYWEEPWGLFAALYNLGGELVRVEVIETNQNQSWLPSATALPDGSFLLAGEFEGTSEFLVGEDTRESITAQGGQDGFLLHVCP